MDNLLERVRKKGEESVMGMTKEEAIIIIGNLPIVPDGCYSITEYQEAKTMAIKALEQEPCEDCISREKAKQFLYERLDRLNDDELYNIFSRIIDDMYNELPPITPTTQWHKVETRPLTEEEKEIYGEEYAFMYDCKMPDGEQEVLIKTKWGIEKTTYYTDDGCYFEGYEDEDDVIAWTELPE